MVITSAWTFVGHPQESCTPREFRKAQERRKEPQRSY
jgi:hypothetical protein